jgi:hypothetical protein
MIIREGRTPNDKKPRRLILTPQEGHQVRVEIRVPHSGQGYAMTVDTEELRNFAPHDEGTIDGRSSAGTDARLTVQITEVAGIYARSVEQDEHGNWHDVDGGYAIRLFLSDWQTALAELP